VLVAQLDLTVGDLAANEAAIAHQIEVAEARGADLLVLPELAITGYPLEDLLGRADFVDAQLAVLDRLAARTGRCAALIGFVQRCLGSCSGDARERALHNSVAVCQHGRVVTTRSKRLLPDYGPFDETRWFGAEEGRNRPVEVNGHLLGVLVCEDLWDPSGETYDFFAPGGTRAVDFIVSVNASPWSLRKEEARRAVAAEAAVASGVPVLYVNQVGGQDGVVYDGQSFVADRDGKVVWQAGAFGPGVAVLEVDRVRGLVGYEDIEGQSTREEPLRSEEEQVWAALMCGLRGYVEKNGFPLVWVGLSGGIDSAVVAALAADALGADRVRGLLMPSQYSSSGSLTDARALADALGVMTWVVPVAAPFAAIDGALKAADNGLDGTPGPLAGSGPLDATEENLQARIRGMYLMACTNKLGGIVLSTGNKSELAVGYSTVGGDLMGGLALIGDVPKTLVYRLARWRNSTPTRPGSPIPEATITKAPSAELAPGQQDSDSLPPYPLLDAIIERYVDQDNGLAAIVAAVSADPALTDELEALGPDALEATVARVIKLIDRAEYKRRQGPPCVRISEKAWGRDRRMPITNGWRG
jgi:NAD+ synthase (glutamine-hydrolysing)